MPVSKLKPEEEPLGKGASKTALRTSRKVVSKVKQGKPDYALAHGKNFDTEFVLMQINKNQNAMYNELKLNKEFADLEISPRIWYVIIGDEHEQISLRKFLTDYNETNAPVVHSYLVEKVDCGRDVLKPEYYTNYIQLFNDLRRFISMEIVANGYLNTDIKLGNLCIDPETKEIMMIDLDPNRVMRKQVGIRDEVYVDYMLFQIFVEMVKSGHNIRFDELFNQRDIITMIAMMMQNFTITNYIYHPLQNLFWYSGLRTSNAKEFIEGRQRDPVSYNPQKAFELIMTQIDPQSVSSGGAAAYSQTPTASATASAFDVFGGHSASYPSHTFPPFFGNGGGGGGGLYVSYPSHANTQMLESSEGEGEGGGGYGYSTSYPSQDETQMLGSRGGKRKSKRRKSKTKNKTNKRKRINK